MSLVSMRRCLSIGLLALAFSCRDQPIAEATLANDLSKAVLEYMQPLLANRDFAGVICISRGTGLLFQGAWGYAEIAQGVEHTLDSRFAIASITKSLTAASIIKLKTEGRLSYEDAVGRYLPQFTYGDKIKIEHLLRFESGLAEVDADRAFTSEELLAEIGAQPLVFEPGMDSRYGNSGFDVLAMVVEAISGMSFGEYLGQTFLEPLNMAASGLRRDLKPPDTGLSAPYVPGPPPELLKREGYANPFNHFGSGGMYATARDLGAWGRAVAHKEIVDVFAEAYPWGWGRTEVAGHRGLEQTGMQTGFVASLQVFPDEDIVIVMLSNIENGLWVAWSKDLARMVFGEKPLVVPQLYDYQETLDKDRAASLLGRYALNVGRFVDIREVGGSLWLYLNDYPIGRYMLPLKDGDFQLRDFTGHIRFQEDDGKEAPSFTWYLPEVWHVDPEVYTRVER